ncbi:MAG: WD40/YVTN/BNR-like repeat-containing protein, partial [Candidatus Promineifilaceae bacterium]
MNRSMPKILARILPLLLFITAGAWLLRQPVELAPESAAGRQAQADAAGLSGAARTAYISGMAEDTAAESQARLAWSDYLITRYTYPTFEFDQRWLLEAREQDAKIESAAPAGRRVYSRAGSASPLGLDPESFTALGPAPLDNGQEHVGGRANVIASDPVDPAIAYFGSDGGGVWKTTNCCDANTVWEPITDEPLINSIAIGDIILDPNDHDTIYVGTGDLRYGSFSFGSAGLLKSTDGGATWEVLGIAEFAPPRPQDPG